MGVRIPGLAMMVVMLGVGLAAGMVNSADHAPVVGSAITDVEAPSPFSTVTASVVGFAVPEIVCRPLPSSTSGALMESVRPLLFTAEPQRTP